MRVCMLFLKIYVTFVRREQKRMNKRENNMKKIPIPDGLPSHPGGVLWL